MRRVGLALWALWLVLTPIGLVWAQACVCAGRLKPFCCSERTALFAACCASEASSSCCSTHTMPCSDCSGCQLAHAKPMPFVTAPRIALDWADWVLDAPELTALSISPTEQACFGLPAVRNHSPPLEPSAPRAPPLG
ncbi:MAG: hypothetical protein N2554_04345 [Fimbriimonadales bacterium]|nr:hypothetical protein [Fimbriimonadales bacterium]